MAPTLAERLRLARGYTGLSARKISALAGLAPSHVGYLETTAGANPEVKTIAAIARVFGVTTGWLMSGEGKDPTERQICESVTAAISAHGDAA